MKLDPMYEQAREIECEIRSAEGKLESAKGFAKSAANGVSPEKNIGIARGYVEDALKHLNRLAR